MRSSISITDPKWSGSSGWNATIIEHVSSHHTVTLGNVEVWYEPTTELIVRIPSRKTSIRKVVNAITPKTIVCFIEDSTGYECAIEGIAQAMENHPRS